MQRKFILPILVITIFVSISTIPAFASNSQVYIKNSNSTKECTYVPSCYIPYQITVSVGDTITWTNLDNNSHTVTSGTTNYGAVANFDSGIIEPGKSFTQFFGTVGKIQYFDKTDPWVTGLVIVGTGKTNHAELAWVNGSLNIVDPLVNTTSVPVPGKPIIITKNIYNSGGVDAPSILFRLKIKNDTNYLVYDNIVKANVGAKQTVPIGFNWIPEKSGNYQLFFDADPSNTIGDTNENNDVTYDNLIVFNGTSNKIIENTPKFNYTTTFVPEFGQLAPIVLTVSIISIIIFSSKLKFSNLT